MAHRMTQLETVQNEAKELFRKKNTDYGDAFSSCGSVGVIVRLGDKIQRLQSITSRSIVLVNDEKLRDTLMDLHNYAAMAVMLLDENRQSDSSDSPTTPTTPDKTDIKKWTINGDTDSYQRQCFKDKYGNTVNICSCPSFNYCRENKQTCKHIKNDAEYTCVD